MAITPFKKIRTQSPAIEYFQSSTNAVFADIVNREILDGILLRDIPLLTGQTNLVNHKLQRKAVGYIVVRNNANSVVYDSQDTNDHPNLSLALLCSADTTVSLWVF